MESAKSKAPVANKPKYQQTKVYIKDLLVEESLETYQRDLKKSLAKYGNILDIKVLQNR